MCTWGMCMAEEALNEYGRACTLYVCECTCIHVHVQSHVCMCACTCRCVRVYLDHSHVFSKEITGKCCFNKVISLANAAPVCVRVCVCCNMRVRVSACVHESS